MANPMLEVHDLTFGYAESSPVLKGIRFKAVAGERIGIVGHSGSGKSTLVQLLAGLLAPLSGDVLWQDVSVSAQANTLIPGDTRIALVSQKDRLLPGFTVFEQMDYGLRKLQDADRMRRIQRLAGVLQIRTLLDRNPDTLSGGERQRVNLAVQLCRPAEIWLLDEPFTYLDAPMRRSVWMFLQTDASMKRALVLLVSHLPEEIFAFAERVLVIKQGRLLRDTKPMTLYRSPRTRYEAGLLGECTVIRSTASGPVTVYRPEDWEVSALGEVAATVLFTAATPQGFFTWLRAIPPHTGNFGLLLPRNYPKGEVVSLHPKALPVWPTTH
jgi:iron(III) transport system ATP-binding protein/putative spermidine/putrescine transport system ATP-binding protein